MATSWGQRKALGRRYSVDPALVMEQQRLQEEYNLMIPRAQLSEQKRQFDENMEMRKDAQQTAMVSDAVSGIGDLYLTNKYIKAIEPAKAATNVASNAAGAVSNVAWTPNVGTTTLAPTMGVVPSTTGLGAAEGTVGLGGILGSANAPATGAITTATQGTTAGASGGLMASMAPYMAPFSTGLLAGTLAKSGTGKEVGKALLFGGGGEKEQAAAAGVVGGAASGAAMGSVLPGVGTIVGGVIGGIVGGISSLFEDSWICTACNRIVGMSKEEIDKMDTLRMYCTEKHKGWLDAYIIEAPMLVKEIAESEKDIKAFYNRIREVLIEPILKEEDLEKCFEIYLSNVQDLFNRYMPEFEFKEAE